MRTLIRSTAPWLATSLLLAACNNNPAELGAEPASLELGRVAISRSSQASTLLTNLRTAEVTLGAVAASDLGIAAPLSLTAETTCITGTVLRAGESCVLAVSFAPTEAGVFSQTLLLPYASTEANNGAETLAIELQAEGFLDCGVTPDHPACPEDADLSLSGSPELNFGSIDLFSGTTSQIVVVTNTDADEPTTLGDISDAGLNLDGQFRLLPGTTCTSGQMLAAAGGRCELLIQYRPSIDGFERDTLVVPFTEPSGTPAENIQLRLVGRGLLNCAAEAGLTTARTQGVSDAQTRNVTEAARGTADGAALTYEDGRQRTYPNAYNTAYNSAYDAAYRVSYVVAYEFEYDRTYTDAYNNTYSDRFYELTHDTSVCSRGRADGRADGESEGFNDGDYAGYNDGYEVGYPDGLTEGYDEGVDSAASACYGDGGTPYVGSQPYEAAAGGEIPSPTDPVFVTGCYNQGYTATYDPSSYQNAYNASAAANSAYQNGRRDGTNQGRADGSRDGTALGDTNGRIEGAAEGRIVGRSDGIAQALADAAGDAEPYRQAQYNNCYADGYEEAYGREYTNAYYPAYDRGYYAGNDDGYDDSYSNGYSAVSCCFDYVDKDGNPYTDCTSASPEAPRARVAGELSRGRGARYGQGQSWWSLSPRGDTMADTFVKSGLPQWLIDRIGTARAEQITTRANTSRGMDLREALRQEKRLAPPARRTR